MASIDMLERVARQYPVSPASPVSPGSVQNPQTAPAEESGGFSGLFRQEYQRSVMRQTPGIAFSRHAIARVEERGIEVTPALMDRLAASVEKAQAKGATNIVAMGADKAFIINIPTAKVITAISQNELRDNVFTNIDGAVFL